MGVGQFHTVNFQFQQKTKNVKMLTSPIVGISVYSKLYTQIMHCARPRHQYAPYDRVLTVKSLCLPNHALRGDTSTRP